MSSKLCHFIGAMIVVAIVACRSISAHPETRPTTAPDPAGEAIIHTPQDFATAGKPTVCADAHPARLRVKIIDRATGLPAYSRVNIVGADGNFYEPADNLLAPWSLQKLGNRVGKGPFRYFGWFFYTSGEFEVIVPPGKTRIEAWRGFEYRPISVTTDAVADAVRDVRVEIERTAPMAAEGYFSGDTHIHLSRRNETDDARALDLLAAEDIEYGVLLAFNVQRTYKGTMNEQGMPQDRGFGRSSVAHRGSYSIVSGQEYVTSRFGHICLMLHPQLVQKDHRVDPNRWPLLGILGQETRGLGGYSIHAHGGYALEIYADFAQRATDAVELLQFAEYRGIGLEGWYRILGAGFRFPAVGACDYPFCRLLGDNRTYVYSPKPPDMEQWIRGAAEGRSFFTTGPLLLLEVDGHHPADVIRRSAGDSKPLSARVRVRSEVTPVSHVELLVNGKAIEHRDIPPGKPGEWFEFTATVGVRDPLWIAARAWDDSPPGLNNAMAHTNPVYVTVDGKLPYREADVDWLVGQLTAQMQQLETAKFDERQAVIDFYAKSREELLNIRRSGGQHLE